MSAEYLALLDKVLSEGKIRSGEKPETTRTIFGGLTIQFNIAEDGFPLLTIRDLTKSWNNIIRKEAIWMISGSTNANEAEEKYGLKLWKRWAEDSRLKLGTPEGELGPIYGHQLRNWNYQTDQLSVVIDMLKRSPQTRRGIVNLWNIDEVEQYGVKNVNVANCISSIHFARMDYQTKSGGTEERLDMIMTHRSVDLPAGAPHDWAGWALIQMLVARELDIPAGTLTAELHDTQIYDIQIEKVKELLKRQPLPKATVTIEGLEGTIYDAMPEHFVLHNYQSHEAMFMPTAT